MVEHFSANTKHRKIWPLKTSPVDGHCLLHAVYASLMEKDGENLSKEYIMNKLSDEFKKNYEFYNKFSIEGQNSQTEIQRYIAHRKFSNNTGDMILAALNTASAIKTTVVQVDGNQIVTSIESHGWKI